MLDRELLAECIGIIKTNPTVTVMQVSNELQITQVRAKEILDQLEDCRLIHNFGDFYGSDEFVELN